MQYEMKEPLYYYYLDIFFACLAACDVPLVFNSIMKEKNINVFSSTLTYHVCDVKQEMWIDFKLK